MGFKIMGVTAGEAGGDLKKTPEGKWKFIIASNGL